MHDWKTKWEDYYEILGIGPNADEEAIKRAYKEQSFIHHPDRMQNAPESVRKRAEEELKKINRAYDNLGSPEERHEYRSEWLKREGQTSEKTILKSQPIVEPSHINFANVTPGEVQTSSFVVRNNGGSYDFIRIPPPASWIRVLSVKSLTSSEELPLRVEIEALGEEWDKTYSERIKIKLDEEETYVRVDLTTRSRASDKAFSSSSNTNSSNRQNLSTRNKYLYKHKTLNRSSQFIRLHLATAIISLSIIPLAGFFWLLSTYPGLMETPTIYPEDIPTPLMMIGVFLIWLLSPLPWLLADKLIDLSKLNSLGSGLGWPVILVGVLHLCGCVITTILVGSVFTSSFDAQTPKWLVLTISCCSFPAGIASVLWILIGYPINLLRIILR